LIVGITRELKIKKLEGINCPIFSTQNRYSNTEFAILSSCGEKSDSKQIMYFFIDNDDYSTTIMKKEELQNQFKLDKIEFCNKMKLEFLARNQILFEFLV